MFKLRLPKNGKISLQFPKLIIYGGIALFVTVISATSVQAMHIMEGFLPLKWAVFWWLCFIPFWIIGVRNLTKITKTNPELKLLLALATAFIFVLSALKIPSVTGSSSHPTGTGLGSILFGPLIMSVLGSMVLFFQALLLAHGGLTTLGANGCSMAVIGPLVGYGVYKLVMGVSQRQTLAVFLTASIGNITTYVVTSFQLALAFPDPLGGFMTSFLKFATIFALTQIPLAISEGFLTVVVWNWLQRYSLEELKVLQLIENSK